MIINKFKFVSIFLSVMIAICSFSCDKNHSQSKVISNENFLTDIEIKINQKPDSILFLTADLLKNVSKNNLDDEKLLKIYQLRQKTFSTLQNMDSVFSNGEMVRKIALRIPDSLAFAQSLLITVAGNADYGSMQKIEKDLPSAIAVFRNRNMLLEMNRLNAAYGALLTNKGEYKKAQQLLLKAYRLFGQLEEPLYRAKVSDLIGTNYGYMGSPKESLKYYSEALAIAENHNDSLLLSNICSNLGIYHRKVNPGMAINYYHKALSYIPRKAKSLNRIKTNYNLANLFYDKGDYKSAEEVYQKMLLDCKKGNFNEGIAMANNGLASVYNQTKRQNKGLTAMLNAVQLSDSLGMTNLSLMLKPELISIYKRVGDYKNALVQAEQMKSLNDSILSKEKQLAVHELEIKYQTKEKDLENKHLSAQLIFRKNTIIVLIVLVLFSLGLVFLYQQRSKLLKERNRAYDVLMRKYKEEKESKSDTELEVVNISKEPKGNNSAVDLFEKLVEYYEQEKPYLNSKLKAEYVAKQLQVSQKAVTASIKSNGYIGFSNFTNKFRVEEVKKCFGDANYSLLKMEAIATQSGFGSRQSFFTAFEEFTGVNPGFYRSEISKPL